VTEPQEADRVQVMIDLDAVRLDIEDALPRRRELVCRAVSLGHSISEVARQAGVSRPTVLAWLGRPSPSSNWKKGKS